MDKDERLATPVEQLENSIKSLFRQILHRLEEIARMLRHQHHEHGCNQAVSATLTFTTSKGDSMSDLNVNLNDSPGLAVYQEFDGAGGSGNKVAPTGAVAYASDNPAVATVDAVSGQLAYLSVGVANISASDGGNLPASGKLTVGPATIPPPGPAVSSTLTLVAGTGGVVVVPPGSNPAVIAATAAANAAAMAAQAAAAAAAAAQAMAASTAAIAAKAAAAGGSDAAQAKIAADAAAQAAVVANAVAAQTAATAKAAADTAAAVAAAAAAAAGKVAPAPRGAIQ